MNYLYGYLKLLSPAERAGVQALELAPREHEVLGALLAACDEAESSRDQLLGGLKMSGAHFDKISSLVLRRAYEVVVPEGGLALLYDLNRRALYPNFFHEYRRQRKLMTSADAEERAEFHLQCVNLLSRLARDHYSERLVAEAAREYDRLRPSPDNAIYFEACIISGIIWGAAARGTNAQMREEVARRLRANAARITERTGSAALFKHYNAYALFHAQMDEQPTERLRYLEAADALTHEHPAAFTREDVAILRGKIAESHYFNSSNLHRAYRLYAAAFRAYADVLVRDFYHTTKFIQLAIICGHHARAERLLRQRFGLHLSSEHQSIGTMGAISWAKLWLARGRVREAMPYVDFGFRHNRKNFFVQYEIELRILQTIAFAMQGDDEFVEQLAEKNLKYLRSKGFTLATSRYYPWTFKLLVAFVAERNGAVMTRELCAKLAEFDEGAAAVYGVLLRRARAGMMGAGA